jgi:hypothetical protein
MQFTGREIDLIAGLGGSVNRPTYLLMIANEISAISRPGYGREFRDLIMQSGRNL